MPPPVAIQPSRLSCSFMPSSTLPLSCPIQLKVVKSVDFVKPEFSDLKISRRRTLSASAVPADDSSFSPSRGKEKLGVVVKLMKKPRLVLKFIWMEKNLGLTLDQVIPGHGTIPLTPYYFWPRKDAWEQLRLVLESKPWISRRQMIMLLNQAADVINLWQQSGGEYV
ncbi:hypothetical protein RJ639_033858 [Escallonia herrerae]|uniref:30S ribosomal protein 3, chloroplastic n=1 Tax=Escallonia herrerae TaxID=1293975 RepID=A0AA88WYA8_9ASTE|nr:hypothetical protein RJ639_033858 [Escallonia herrerae]